MTRCQSDANANRSREERSTQHAAAECVSSTATYLGQHLHAVRRFHVLGGPRMREGVARRKLTVMSGYAAFLRVYGGRTPKPAHSRTCRCAVGNARQTCSRYSPDLSLRARPTRALSGVRRRATSSPISSSRSRTRRREISASSSRQVRSNTCSAMFRRIHRVRSLCRAAPAIRPASCNSRRARARHRSCARRHSCCRRASELFGHSTKVVMNSS